MTTTEPTIDGLDEQLKRLDDALTRLTAQRDGVEFEAKNLADQWRERAAWGDVDSDLTTRRQGFEASLSEVDEAIRLNRAKYGEVTAERQRIAAAQQLAADCERYTVDAAAFAARTDAATLIDRLLNTVYGVLRATNAELGALHQEEERLKAEAARVGAPTPASKMTVPWSPDHLGRVPTQLVRGVLELAGWPREEHAVNALTEYLRVRVFATSRENPSEPAPTWAQAVKD